MKKVLLYMVALLLLFSNGWVYAQVKVSGTVVDTSGSPLGGATVKVKGTNTGAVTDGNGAFSFETGQYPVEIDVSYLGFQTASLVVKSATPVQVNLQEGSKLDAVVIVGTRGKARTVLTSPVPIDNINVGQLKTSGQSNVDQMINFKVPSYNSTNQTISDATAHFDPSELRNLGPSRTLVLINGKRKNLSSLVYINETPGRSEVGTDMKSIPVSAIKRIEVLRDGASALYGSDAIAGVINVVLKDGVEEGVLDVETGATTFGDGFQYSIDANKGFRLGKKGSINLSASHYYQDVTDRAGETPVPGADLLFGVMDNDWIRRNPDLGMTVGQPQIDKWTAFANLKLPTKKGGVFYVDGGYTKRRGKSFALYRVPYWISGNNNPLAPATGEYAGFQPTFETTVDDTFVSLGYEFNVKNWKVDLSGTFGENEVDYLVDNSINVSLGLSSPTRFNVGGYGFSNRLINVDISRSFNNQVHLSLGAVYRNERFIAEAGQKESYEGGGVQSFPGLQPSNAVNATRKNAGAYLGVDYDISNAFLVGAAARYERYSGGFGDNFSYKLNARYLLGGNRGTVRVSYSTGFRAPALHQIYLSNIQTLVDTNTGAVNQEGTFSNVNPIVRNTLGVPQLQPETSQNFSVGFAYKILNNLSVSLDYYNVAVNDRVLFTNQISTGDLPSGNAVRTQLQNNGVENFKFFVNALDTTTSGFDIVIDYNNIVLGKESNWDIIFALNTNQTAKRGEINSPSFFQQNNINIFNREEQARVSTARPNLKFSLANNVDIKKFSFNLNFTYFGKVTWQHPTDITKDQTFSGKMLTDLALRYRVSNRFRLNFSINNLLDVYPDVIDNKGDVGTDLGYRFKYPWEVNQFGFLGAIYKVGASFNFL